MLGLPCSAQKIDRITRVILVHLTQLIVWANENEIDPRTVLSVLNWEAAGFIVHRNLGGGHDHR